MQNLSTKLKRTMQILFIICFAYFILLYDFELAITNNKTYITYTVKYQGVVWWALYHFNNLPNGDYIIRYAKTKTPK